MDDADLFATWLVHNGLEGLEGYVVTDGAVWFQPFHAGKAWIRERRALGFPEPELKALTRALRKKPYYLPRRPFSQVYLEGVRICAEGLDVPRKESK